MRDLNTYFLIGLNWSLCTSEAGRTKKAYSPTLLCVSLCSKEHHNLKAHSYFWPHYHPKSLWILLQVAAFLQPLKSISKNMFQFKLMGGLANKRPSMTQWVKFKPSTEIRACRCQAPVGCDMHNCLAPHCRFLGHSNLGLIWCLTHLVAFLRWRVASAVRGWKLVVSEVEERRPATAVAWPSLEMTLRNYLNCHVSIFLWLTFLVLL